MPAKRKGRTRGSVQKASESSSEDSELRKTQEIINRLSVKYKKRTHGKRSIEKNQEPAGYEGDTEPSIDSSTPSQSDCKMSTDEYEFNEPDLPGSGPLKKSGGRKTKKRPVPKPSRPTNKKSKAGDGKRREQSSSASQSSGHSWDENESGIEISFVLPVEPRSKKVMQPPIAKSTPALKRVASEMKENAFSPRPTKLPRFMTAETSTPSNFARPPKRMTMDDCFGFDSLESPAPMPSPVRRVITPMSDYGTMTPSGFESSSQRSQTSSKASQYDDLKLNLEAVDTKPEKKKRKANYKQWAKEKSTEFSEIENFELCIE